MNFKSFLVEDEQVSIASETSLTDEKVRDEINLELNHVLTDVIFSPESGIQKIRRVLHLYGYDMPALYDANPEGDEVVLDLDNNLGVYILYTLTDENDYEFYAEVGIESRMQELLSDEGEPEEV